VAIHDILGRDLQRVTFHVSTTVPGPDQGPEHESEAGPLPAGAQRPSNFQRRCKAHSNSQGKDIQILRVKDRQDQVNGQREPSIGRLKTVLNISGSFLPYLAPCKPCT